jgi:hypothetical protein
MGPDVDDRAGKSKGPHKRVILINLAIYMMITNIMVVKETKSN